MARAAQAEALPPEPPPSKRELPSDPAAREAALSEGRPTAVLILSILNVVAKRLPPQRPLSSEETLTIQGPLEIVIFKYSANVPPEWALAIAIGSIGFMRYVEVHPEILAKLGLAPNTVQAAATQTVEVKQ